MRKFLRIAVTVVSLAACLAIMALWVSSYWQTDHLYGEAALLTAMLAAAPWINWRFRVRTLLIGLTVVAVILALAVWEN